ncbi:MAG TPA: hypothetical protein VLA56_15855 [Pseudomonadales bacterium]|nr:hypothetical protein [Pseudomonadales bacterium]
MTRLVSLFTLLLTLVATSTCVAAVRAGEEAPEFRTRLADRAQELRKRGSMLPKMGARQRSGLNARIASIDAALDVLDAGGSLSAERMAQLLGEAPPREVTLDERIARVEARLDRSPKLGAVERRQLRKRLISLRANDTPGAEATPRARALELERATLKRRLLSGSRLGQRERARMRDRVEEIDRRLAQVQGEEAHPQVPSDQPR